MISRINSPHQVGRMNQPVVAKAEGFSPTDIEGCAQWLDFSDADTLFTDAGTTKVTTDGDLIYQANDKSGNVRHVLQAVSDSRPVYKENIKNGKSVALVDGIDDYLEGNFTSLNTSSFFMVYNRFVSPGSDIVILYFGPKGLEPWKSRNAIYTELRSSNRSQLVSGTVLRLLNTAMVSTNTFYLVSQTINTSEAKFHVNGGNTQNQAISSVVSSCDFVILGCTYNGGYDGFANVQYAEIIVYNTALTDTDRIKVETYLNNKWNIY